MPIGFRPARSFALTALGTGAVITDTAINGFENLMSHLASRGGHAQTEIARRINAINWPIVGFRGGSQGFIHGRISTFWQLPIAGGMNTITMFAQYRLNKTFQNENKGSNLTFYLVLNGVQKQVFKTDWRETLANQPFEDGYTQLNISIGDLFKMPIEQPATMCLVAVFDTCDGDVTKYGQQVYSGFATNPTFYNGLNYLGYAAWRDCKEC